MLPEDVVELRLTVIHDPSADRAPDQYDLGPIVHEVSAYTLFQQLPDHRGRVTECDVLGDCVFHVDAHGPAYAGAPFGRILEYRLVPVAIAEALYDKDLSSAVARAISDDGAGMP